MHSLLFGLTGLVLSLVPIAFVFFTLMAIASRLIGRSLTLASSRYRMPLISVPFLVLILEALYYWSGQIFIREGILNMTKQQLLLEIVDRMNNAAKAFVWVALISMAVSVICSAFNKGNPQEIRHIARSCAWFAFLFWFISWIII